MYGLDTLIMPQMYLRALKEADRHVLNFAQIFSDFMNMDASVGDIGTANAMEIDLVSKCINPNLPQLIPLLADEADYMFALEIGKVNGNLVHHISNRVIVGPGLCRNVDYMKACKSYATTVFISGIIWNFLPLGPFRTWIYWIGSFKHRMDLRRAAKYLLPIFEERMANQSTPANGVKPVDAIQWLIDMPPTSPAEIDARRHANRILHLTFAGTGTSISLTQHLIWQILLDPEYLEPLREEIGHALAEYGGWSSEKALSHMHLLDSFIRETLRLNPPGVFGGARSVMHEPYTFHDGLTLEPGTRIAFPMLSPNLDPDNYDDSKKFKGFRFAGPEAIPESQARVSATTIDEKFMSFGYGRQACPGRFFSIRLVKLIFGRLIYEYDIKWAKPTTARPKGMVLEGMITPNMDTEISLRHRGK
ncbi:MAG: hypothetical protein M1830_000726 [Pleopsidium flavum]|nr:MAG: hypothetical protein M1830_000726 [Pleopsidium flavum]